MTWELPVIVGAVLLLVGYIAYKKIPGEHVIRLLSYGMILVGAILFIIGLIYLYFAYV